MPINALINNPQPTEEWLSWLTCTTYMMERLRAKAGPPHLDVLQQKWELTNSWDEQNLSLASQTVLHRDIMVTAAGHVCWFARTILPKLTYDAHEELFKRLEHEPLGNLIFHSERIQRVGLDYYAIHPEAIEYQWLPASLEIISSVLWVRRSIFRVAEKEHFYLLEILLPALEHYFEK